MERYSLKQESNVPISPEDDHALKACEVAALVGVAQSTAEDARWRQRVGLRGFRVGHALRFKRRDVLALIEAGGE